MLGVAERSVDGELDILLSPATPARPVHVETAPVFAPSSSRYGKRTSPNWLVIALILVAHAVLITAIMHVRQQVLHKREARLSVIDLTPPPPPPAEEAPPPPPSQPQIVSPPPLVQVPLPPVQQIATTPQPAPPVRSAPAVTISVPVAPASAPALPSVAEGGDLSARMISGKPPRYPIESRRKHEQGTVALTVTLGLDGGVETIAIARSSGFSRLDDAAKDAVRHWRWKPMIQQGQPVKVKGVVEIPFVLQISAT